jgi:hypothetical protein
MIVCCRIRVVIGPVSQAEGSLRYGQRAQAARFINTRRDKLAILEHFKNSQLLQLYGSTEQGWAMLLRPADQLSWWRGVQAGSLATSGRNRSRSSPTRTCREQQQASSCTAFRRPGFSWFVM